ncbi:hypothetical protein FSP39_006717 [Pinctada imbricata]|uniref:Uncharacterized protein n=1 Tax=Pinctada imbricata TaxID=66713 RepID=A0AA89BV29_PINIB|nr:hypothetical protein FSP39_006717 [Pinctada imbricata]
MKQSSKDYKREINKSYSKYQFEMEKEIRNTSKTDSRQFWKILNKLNGKNEPEIKASLDDLFAYFKVINEGEDDEEEFNTSDEGDETFNTDILNENISEKEIEDSIRNLKNNKAKGFDDISNEYIKHSINIFMPLYVKLFNLILNTGKIPKAWGYGIIHPIYKKKGDPKNPESYRPITLTSALGKVFTSIIDTRLRNFANSQETISMAQAGFRKGFSTTDNIFCLYSFIQLYLNCGKKLFCTFIDFKKAFDTVWRIGLWRKLQNTNIKGKIFKVIYNMYKDIKSCVRKNSECSEFFPCMTGVRQGENLSPFLFTIFLNDIKEFLTHQGMTGLEIIETKLKEELHLYMKIFLLLYADDTVILADTPENLQLTLKAFERYCEHWKLKINVDKTKVLIFEKRRNRTVRNFFLNEIEIEVVDSYCYLGILFNYNGNFLKARNHLLQYLGTLSKPTDLGDSTSSLQIYPKVLSSTTTKTDVLLKSSELFPKGCSNKPADVVFLFDTSSGVSTSQLDAQTSYARDLQKLFYTGRNTTVLTAAVYGSRTNDVPSPQNDANKGLPLKMLSFSSVGGKRNLTSVMNFIELFSRKQARRHTGHVAILFISGSYGVVDDTIARANYIRRTLGIYIYVIKVGNFVGKSDVTKIASSPSRKFVFHVTNSGTTASLKELLNIHLCDFQIHPRLTTKAIPKCVAKRPVDVIFSLDEVSIGARHSQIIIYLIEALVSGFDSYRNNINIALVNSKNINFAKFGRKFKTVDNFMRRLGTVKIPDHSQMLRKSRRVAFYGRKHAQKVIIHFVDRNVDINKATLSEAKQNRNSKMETYVIAIGTEVELDVTSLEAIASRPSDRYVITVPRYQQLVNHWRQILPKICTGI